MKKRFSDERLISILCEAEAEAEAEESGFQMTCILGSNAMLANLSTLVQQIR
ncbi:hypothetical protein [Serratia sp. 1D1416]|uniref:hypothetical protein n=1 Tax=Serratia sp. 1D1416 TaxID=2447890 RepID=UPI0013EA9ED9|nr:hypothetical protein [Serratia sp. 1D1416]